MTGPPTRERPPPHQGGRLHQPDHGDAHRGRGDGTTTVSDTRGDLARFVAGRDRTLGRAAMVPRDVDDAAEVLAAVHGGPRRAAHWLRMVLRQLDARERAS